MGLPISVLDCPINNEGGEFIKTIESLMATAPQFSGQ